MQNGQTIGISEVIGKDLDTFVTENMNINMPTTPIFNFTDISETRIYIRQFII